MHFENLSKNKHPKGGGGLVVTHIYPEFLTFLEMKGWSSLGEDSLALKLGISPSTARAALKGMPMLRRSKYLLWKATGESLDCFNVLGTPLEKWMWERDFTPTKLAEVIEAQTGVAVSVNTLESISQKYTLPTPENAKLLYQVTGLDFFIGDEDPVTATKRALGKDNSSSTEPSKAEVVKRVPQVLAKPLEFPKDGILVLLKRELDQVLGSDEDIESKFESLFDDLVAWRKNPDQAREVINSIGESRYRYWISMLTAIGDPKEFGIWNQMSDHSLGER